MKKKTLLIVSMLVLVMFALTACGSKSPKSVVEDNLKQIKTEKTSSNVSKLFNDKTLEQKYGKEYDKFIKKVQDFDYEVKDEKVDGKKATVKVEIKTYDFGAAYKTTYDTVVADAKSGKITATTDIKDYVYNLMFQNLNSVKDKSYKKTVTINCTKNDKGEWTTDINSNVDFLDAMMGGMFTAIKSVQAGQAGQAAQ
jgi:lipoprotein